MGETPMTLDMPVMKSINRPSLKGRNSGLLLVASIGIATRLYMGKPLVTYSEVWKHWVWVLLSWVTIAN